MKASIGRTVIVKGVKSNGADVQPAIINRVWSGKDTVDEPVAINVMVFPDYGSPSCMTSVMLYDTEEIGEAATKNQNHTPVFAFWPPRA